MILERLLSPVVRYFANEANDSAGSSNPADQDPGSQTAYDTYNPLPVNIPPDPGGPIAIFPPIAPYSGGRSYAPPPPAAPQQNPSDAAYTAIPQEYRNILEDLEHSWQLAGGFASQVTTQNLVDMAKQHVVSLSDFGKFMWSNGGLSDATKQQMPWLGVGLTQGEYQKATNGFSTEWLKLTGQKADLTGIGTAGTAADTVDARKYIWDALNSGATASDFSEGLMHDKAVTDTYKWLSHGIDYDQFQLKKQDMSREFGGNLTDDQAVLQLTYLQRNSTFEENQAVHAGLQTGQEQSALTQGAVGVSGSTSR